MSTLPLSARLFGSMKLRHYKGRVYEIIYPGGVHTETLEPVVVYALDGDGPWLGEDMFKIWIRPRAMFDDLVEHEGKTIPRFVEIEGK